LKYIYMHIQMSNAYTAARKITHNGKQMKNLVGEIGVANAKDGISAYSNNQ